MSSPPKYSDRISFFFVVNGKEIPLKKKPSFVGKMSKLKPM